MTVRKNLIKNPSFEVDTTDWAIGNHTIARTTVQALTGTASLSVTAASTTGGMYPYTVAYAPSTPGQTYTASFYSRANTSVRSVKAQLYWYSATDAYIGVTEGALTTNTTTGWTRHTVTGTAPANAVRCYFQLGIMSVTAGEVHYIDGVLLEQASTAGTYFDGSTANAGGLKYAWSGTAHNSASVEVPSGDRLNLCFNPSFEVDTTGWATPGGGGSTLARSTAQAAVGSASLELTATSTIANDAIMRITGMTPGLDYTIQVKTKSPTISRQFRPYINFRGAAGSIVSGGSAVGTFVYTSTTSWTLHTLTYTAPAGTTQADFGLRFTGCAVGEVHYADAICIEQASSAGTYFDGSTADTSGWDYAWTGTANSSPSTAAALLPPAPVANFTSSATNLSVAFTDTSTNTPTSWSWDFGDGQTSTAQNPTHVYASPGTYTVTLTASNAGGSDGETQSVTVVPPPPVANFSSVATYLTVAFTDTSTGGATSWSWDFGDGNTSTLQNPTHTYASPGSYTVTLTATNAGGSDGETKTVSVTTAPPVASFTHTDTYLSVAFSDTSTGGATSWSWDFGDGATSTSQNPTHVYAAAGTYTVTLTATNPGGSDSDTQSVTVAPQPPPVAGFTSNKTFLSVAFTDTSTGAPTSWAWDFGDGATSTLQNPSHTYASAGTYTVTLTATNGGGSDVETQSISVVPPAPVAGFTSSVNQLSVDFTNATTGSVTSYGWDFGDGATSSATNPTHAYASAGTYTVVLTATNEGGSDTETQTVTVGLAPAANFTWSADYLQASFTNTSINAPTSYSWDFGDGGTSTAANPTHTYALSGTYTATLTVTNAFGTDTETKTVTLHAAPIKPGSHALLEVYTSGAWMDITGPTKNINIGRSESDVGLMSAEILDADLDPTTAATLRPGRKVRVSAKNGAAWSPVFTGTIDDVKVDYEPLAKEGKKVNVHISASDNVSYLANQTEPRGVSTINELRWLVTGVPFNINGSSTGLGSGTVISMNDNASLWDNVLITRDSNLGYAWVGKDNVLNVFDSASMDTSTKATIGPDVYTSLDVDFTLDQIINSVVVNWMRYNIGTDSSSSVTYPAVQDAASIAEWGVREATFTVQGATEVEANIVAFANEVLARNATAQVRPRTAEVVIRDTDDLTYVNNVDLNSYVDVVYTDGVTTKQMRVTGINHTITADKWDVEFEFGLPNGVTPPSVAPSEPSYIRDGAITDAQLDPDLSDTIYNAKANAEAALADAADAMNFAQTRNKVFYQTTKPSGGTYTAGDTWYDTDDGNKIYVHNGTDFVVATGSNLITPSGRLTINTSGLYGTDTLGNTTLALNAADGSVTMKGALTSGSSVTGAIITGGTVQTSTFSNYGIKLNSSGLVAYNSGGSPTFSIDGNNGNVSMLGNLVAGSNISGATITGSTFTTSASSSRIEMGSSGGYPTDQIRFFNSGYVSSIRNPDNRPGVIYMSFGENSGGQMTFGTAPDGNTYIQGYLTTPRLKFTSGFIQARTSSDGGYGEFSAAAYNINSERKFKKNVEKVNLADATAVLKKGGLHKWRPILSDKDAPEEKAAIDKDKYGLIADDLPDWMRTEDGYSLSSAVAFLWEALKQANERIEALEKGKA